MIFPEWLEQVDRAGFLLIHRTWKNAFFESLMPLMRNRDTWVPFYVLLAAWLLVRLKWKGLLLIAIIGAVTGLADLVSSSVLKPVVGRDRPCHEVQLEGEVFPMVHCGNNGSFTSSHAANHMALAAAISMLLLRRRKWLAALLYFWAFLIGYAQIYVGVHYPTDVLGGFLLGFLLAWLAVRIAIRSGLQVPE